MKHRIAIIPIPDGAVEVGWKTAGDSDGLALAQSLPAPPDDQLARDLDLLTNAQWTTSSNEQFNRLVDAAARVRDTARLGDDEEAAPDA